MFEGTDLKTIADSGAIGLCILLIGVILYMFKINNKSTNNHFNHFTDAINNNTKVMGQATEVMRQNVKIMDRIENKLNR